MFSKELESVIEAALADGVLTDKEREVLHRRAAAEGVDPDELDVVIDGRLAKMKREEDWLRPTPPEVSDKYGDVKKCPRCGEPVEPMAVKCSACGYEFRNVEALNSSQRLADKLEAIDEFYRGKTITDSTLFGKFDMTKSRIVNEKSSIIKNFPIPTTKEDLLDFAINMRTNWANTSSIDGDVAPIKKAYKAKYDECIAKAELLFPDDPQFQTVFEKAEKDKSIISRLKHNMGPMSIFFIIFIVLIILFILISLFS